MRVPPGSRRRNCARARCARRARAWCGRACSSWLCARAATSALAATRVPPRLRPRPPRTCRASVEKLLAASVDLTLVAARPGATRRLLLWQLHEPAAPALALVSAGDDDAIAGHCGAARAHARGAPLRHAPRCTSTSTTITTRRRRAADGDIASLGRTELVSAFVTAVGKVLCSVSICADEGVARAAHELENATAALGVGGEQSRHAWQSA